MEVESERAMGGRPTVVAVLAVYAVIIGGASFAIGLADSLDGEAPAIGRALLGLLGVIGGGLLWLRPERSWPLSLAWAVIQVPFFAWNLDGSPTTQLLEVPLSASSKITRNGEVTSYSEFGINLVGVVLTLVALNVRSKMSLELHRQEIKNADTNLPAADRALLEIEALRQQGRITREEANERRRAVLAAAVQPSGPDVDPKGQSSG